MLDVKSISESAPEKKLVRCGLFGQHRRVKDLDFGQRPILVRDAEERKHGVISLPNGLIKLLPSELATAKPLHEQKRVDGYGNVYQPYAPGPTYPQWESLSMIANLAP